jgi:hypothetical protein
VGARIVAGAMAIHPATEHHPCGGELGSVGADPEHKGKGLGMAGCAAVTGRFISARYRDICLRTDNFRPPPLKVHLRVGDQRDLWLRGRAAAMAEDLQEMELAKDVDDSRQEA